MERTLLDISRLGTDTTWPSVAVEVNGYLTHWINAANAQVSEQQLRITTAPNPEASASDPCGWCLEASLDQLTPAGQPAVLLLQVLVTGTAVQVTPGIGNREPFLGSGNTDGWIFPARNIAGSSGSWSTYPLPFNAQLGWSLQPGQEYFVFAYSQHRFSNRQAVPLLIARDQLSGHWILAASPATTSTDALRAVSWNRRSGQPSASCGLLRDATPSVLVRISRPAELILATSDWIYYATDLAIPACRWDPLILPPDFAAVNSNAAAQSYYKLTDGSEWLALGSHGLLLRTKDPTPSTAPTP